MTHFESAPHADDKRLSDLRQKIFEWSRKWNLNESWCRVRAYNTLYTWCEDDSSRQLRCWAFEPVIQSTLYFKRPKFKFQYETDYPLEGTRSDLQREITDEFNRQLKAFLDEREEIANRAGMEPVSKKREMDHFNWLVLYQVKNKSYGVISREAKVTRPTVTEAVKNVARICGLTLRPPKPPGRPKNCNKKIKRKDS